MIEFEIFGSMDLNLEHDDYSIEELKDRDLLELYDQFVDADERQEYNFHENNFNAISIEADGTECKLNIQKRKLEIQTDTIRIITFYYYNNTEYLPCEMTHLSGKDLEVTLNLESLCDEIQYVASITLSDGYNEQTDSDQMYFELESASPSDDEAGMQKIYICDKSGILAKIDADGDDESKELFVKTIKELF